MDDFAEEMRKFFADSESGDEPDLAPNPKESLETLLEHVCQKVLVPFHYLLTEKEEFSSSWLVLDDGIGFPDSHDDGMGNRRVALLTVVRSEVPLFEYWLSFDGDSGIGTAEATIWRKLEIIRTGKLDLDNIPAGYIDSLKALFSPSKDKSTPHFDRAAYMKTILKTTLDEDAIASLHEYVHFNFDMDEVVRNVRKDLYEVCKTLL